MDWRNLMCVLNGLLGSMIDEERVLRACAQNVRDATLREVFEAAAARCEEYAGELERKIRYLGGEPLENDSASGFVRRGRPSLTASPAVTDDRAILVECERGEDVVKRAYEDVLKNDLPVDIRIFVARQYKGMRENHDRIQSFRKVIA